MTTISAQRSVFLNTRNRCARYWSFLAVSQSPTRIRRI